MIYKENNSSFAKEGNILYHKDDDCPNCMHRGMDIFHAIKDFPVHSVKNISTFEEAVQFPVGNIDLGFCEQCGFISNTSFDPDMLEYSGDCEESQGHSPTFNEFLSTSTHELIDKYDIRNKTILEIGCGKGDFLSLICSLGNNRGIGFDPAYIPGRESKEFNSSEGKKKIHFVQDYYSEKYADYQADVLFCRMTLEHISRPYDFLHMIRKAIAVKKSLVCFQVPNMSRILTDCAFEDIYYEHCSYFSAESLKKLFRFNGFEVLDIRSAYSDQYLMLEAVPVEQKLSAKILYRDRSVDNLKQLIAGFVDEYTSMIASWSEKIDKMYESGQRAVIWGSGSKGVAFLNILGIKSTVQYVVDINPYRQGTYMAGTGQKIVPPEFLKDYKPDSVIIMNEIYYPEILDKLKKLGLFSELLCLHDHNKS